MPSQAVIEIRVRRPRRRPQVVLLALLAALGLAAALCASPAAALVGLTRWEPTPARYWAVNRTTIMSVFQNGACTQWAADRRPDIIRRGIKALVAREIAGRRTENWGDWTARYWVGWAKRAHIPHGAAPRAGAIAVFQPGVDGAEYPTGHVAYVERVAGNGSVRISEMNAPTPGKVTQRTLTRAQAHRRGLAYIYR